MAEYDTEALDKTAAHFLEHSKVKSNGVREVNTATYMEVMGGLGISRDDLDRVALAAGHVNTAAARVALSDLENKISEAKKEDLENEEFRKGLKASVRLPTLRGSTEIEATAEVFNNIPFRGDADGNGDGPQRKATYGRLRTTINTKQVIHKDFHAEADQRMRKALGIAPVA